MSEQLTLGSLFDGSGGFPLGGLICGIKPLWASEIEPFPIRVTTKRLPNMKHYGDVSRINGAEVPPVDVLTFGSPCQNLSVAGKREGLNGDRSSLFFEAVRIVKEMREATNGRKPRYIVWENVPGAFSSNGGDDFRAVLQEIVGIKDRDAVIPGPPRKGNKSVWSDAGLIMGDGYSVAWRVLDAQFWGVAQRRRRIYLVGDLEGERAGEILFEREGLPRNVEALFRERQRTAATAQEGAGTAGVCGVFDNRGQDTRFTGPVKVAQTVARQFGAGGNNQPLVVQTPQTMRVRCGCAGGGKGALIQSDKSGTLAVNNDQTLFVPCMWNGGQTAPTLTANNAGGDNECRTKKTLTP
jgi:DNA (cytosine-5)-methyltransferase 1